MLAAVEKSGYKLIEHGDLVELAEEWYGDNNVPWYYDMGQEYSFSSIRTFQLSQFGQNFLNKLLWLASTVGLIPKDVLETEKMLRHGGQNLVAGGKTKVFTPMYYVVAEKL